MGNLTAADKQAHHGFVERAKREVAYREKHFPVVEPKTRLEKLERFYAAISAELLSWKTATDEGCCDNGINAEHIIHDLKKVSRNWLKEAKAAKEAELAQTKLIRAAVKKEMRKKAK